MNRQPIDNSFSGDFSEQISVGLESVRRARDLRQENSAAAPEPRCVNCGSWAVYALGLVHASSAETRAKLSPQGTPSPGLASWLANSDPPEKMTAWTSFTLGVLLWSPCIFLVVQTLHAQITTGHFMDESLVFYLVALGVGVIAWAGPALRRQRDAHSYNSGPWKEKMREWHAARVCLTCGSRQTGLDRLLSNRLKEGLS